MATRNPKHSLSYRYDVATSWDPSRSHYYRRHYWIPVDVSVAKHGGFLWRFIVWLSANGSSAWRVMVVLIIEGSLP
jgi:hypothetical protein